MITKTRTSLVNTTRFLLLGIALSSLHAPRAAAQQAKTPQDVHVANMATDPVPVKIDGTTNTVKIDGTTNTVKIAGSPTVTLAPGAAVQIGNPANSPALFRDVDRYTSQPFRAVLTSTFPSGNAAAITPLVTSTVPGGKRLVIEFVTVNITLPLQQTAQFARLDSNGSFDQYLALIPAGNDGANKPVFIGTHRMFAIFDPGTVLTAFGGRNSGTDTGTVTMTVAGYLVDI
jgi:hypothetical protein